MHWRVVKNVTLSVLGALTFSSCTTTAPDSSLLLSPSDPRLPEGVHFSLDRAEYVAVQVRNQPPIRYEFQLTATLENHSRQALYLTRCHPDSPVPLFGVQLVTPDNPDGSAYDPIWACVGGDFAIVVEPGTTRTDTFRISGPNSFQSGTQVGYGQLDGMFEFAYGGSTCSPATSCPASVMFKLRERFLVRR